MGGGGEGWTVNPFQHTSSKKETLTLQQRNKKIQAALGIESRASGNHGKGGVGGVNLVAALLQTACSCLQWLASAEQMLRQGQILLSVW